MRSVMRMVAGILAAVLAFPSLAGADIFMWRDERGVKHYTNSKDLVPAETSAILVVRDAPAPPPELRVAAPAPSRPAIEARDFEEAVDESIIASAYAQGYQRALANTQQQAAAPPVNVQINGPFVAAAASGGNDYGGYGGYGYGPNWLDYNSPALVTTSFDRGRSRHLTLRMLMQDQFAIDREGPYLIVDRFPPLGPNLTTVMPNGLPYFVRPGSGLVNRVLTH